MIKNVVLVSGVQQSGSVLHIHISIFQTLFPFRFPCAIHSRPLLVTYFKYKSAYVSPKLLICPSPLVTINLLSISVGQNRLAFKFSFEEWFLLLGK